MQDMITTPQRPIVVHVPFSATGRDIVDFAIDYESGVHAWDQAARQALRDAGNDQVARRIVTSLGQWHYDFRWTDLESDLDNQLAEWGMTREQYEREFAIGWDRAKDERIGSDPTGSGY